MNQNKHRSSNLKHSQRHCQVPFQSSIAILALFAIVGCVPRSEKEVVVYASVDRDYASPILDSFERSEKGAVEVSRQFDVEANKSLGLASRIMLEQPSPKCDVFWNGEILHTIRLQKAGLLAPLPPTIGATHLSLDDIARELGWRWEQELGS
jgi:hypothetical protein